MFENDRDEKNRLDDNWAMMRLNFSKAMLESLCGVGLFPISVHYVWTQQHDNLILITTHLGIYQIKIPISLASICFCVAIRLEQENIVKLLLSYVEVFWWQVHNSQLVILSVLTLGDISRS